MKESVKKTEGPIRVVIAEGRGLFCETIKIVLDGEPDMCVQAFAHEGPSALELSEELRPDVLVLDGNLPNGDSLEMTTALKKRQSAMRILFVAEKSDDELIDASLLAGADGYLSKDATLDDFVEGIRSLARGEQFIPSTMLGGVLERLLRRHERREEAQRLTARLTKREREVLSLVAQGSNHDAVAQALLISPHTARTHLQNVLGKLHVHSRAEVIEFVRRHQPLPSSLGVMS
jgi:DNA-binding NarL/FixJ family response regulator